MDIGWLLEFFRQGWLTTYPLTALSVLVFAISFERLNIRIARDYSEVPPILVDRHKLLQILINLLSNARHAMVATCMALEIQSDRATPKRTGMDFRCWRRSTSRS